MEPNEELQELAERTFGKNESDRFAPVSKLVLFWCVKSGLPVRPFVRIFVKELNDITDQYLAKKAGLPEPLLPEKSILN